MENEKNEPESGDPFEKLRKELELIDTKYSTGEAAVVFDEFMKKRGYLKGIPTKKKRNSTANPGNGFVKKLGISPKFFVPSEKHLVRYFFMHYLRCCRYDIVLHEFSYMSSIADIFAVVGGRATEFEIKASREDYFKDFDKTFFMGRPVSKHGSLAKGVTMITRFYFIVPENMIDIRECPPHTGMIWYTMNGDIPEFRVVKYPPVLNKSYVTPGGWQNICKRLQVRCWSLMDRYVNNKFTALKNYNANSNASNNTTDAG